MTDSKCKICRRAGEKLFLKGEKCFTAKCVFNKKPYAPGIVDSQRKHRSPVTEFGRQLKEKQKVRNMYGLRENQFANYVKKASARKGGSPGNALYEELERRIDNVVFRFGFAASRALARQMVSHGHITINGRKVTIPSYQIRPGDIVGIREGSRASALFTNIGEKLGKLTYPNWLAIRLETLEGEVKSSPKAERSEMPFDLASVIEFYSR